MRTRDTKTGWVLEQMVIPALNAGGYRSTKQVLIGKRPGGGKHIIDVLAENDAGKSFLVSVKWQQVSGTAEQKVPFEAICLADAMRTSAGRHTAAYLVLGGEGWTLRHWYTTGGLDLHLRHGHLVKIVTLEAFVAAANRGLL